MCEVLEIPLRTYYRLRKQTDPDYGEYLLIHKVFEESYKTYGYRRVAKELRITYGFVMNEKKVLRIMKKYGLQAQYIQRLRPNYGRIYLEENVKDNLLQRHFDQPGWVTDVTYLVFGGKRAYLSTILDLSLRTVVAYRIRRKNDLDLVMDTLREAIQKKDPSGIILHSDQGSQYLSNEYRAVCEANKIQISMSRKGTPLDNAVIESFHSLLKKETLYNNDIKSLEEYIERVIEWIGFYNTTRRKLRD